MGHVRLLQPQTRRTQIEVEVGVGQKLLFYKMVFINAMNKLKFAARLLPQTVRYPLRAQTKRFSSTPALLQKEWVSITFVDREGTPLTVKGKVGDTFLDAAVNNDVDLEGACEGTLSCSTCHLIFTKEDFDKLPEEATDEEMDMLDLAFGLTDTSRLGCQITIDASMDGMTVKVPSEVADARS